MEKAIVAYERAYRRVATYLVFLPLLAMTVIEFLNAIGRKLFVPFPGTVESVEEVKGNGVEMRLSFTVEVEGSDKPACVADSVGRALPE